MQPKILTIIPARYASTRFPGKPLVDMLGKPMIQRVVEQANKLSSQVVVATDDERILNAVIGFGGQAVMTSEHHRSGTERCIEALEILQSDADIVLNLQGDEPFIQLEQIEQLIKAFDDPEVQIATLAEPFARTASDEEVSSSNVVKLVRGVAGQALYFSRYPIPYQRDRRGRLAEDIDLLKHIGLYAFRRSVLLELKSLTPTPLEQAESLEQLRWLAHGYRIQVMLTEHSTIGIDTPEDLEQALQYLRQRQP